MHSDLTGRDRSRSYFALKNSDPTISGRSGYGCRRRIARRLVAVGLAAGVTAVSIAPDATPASARPAMADAALDRQSPTVVVQATRALRRYRRFVRADTPESLQRYTRARNRAANVTAVAMGVRPRLMRASWAASSRRHQVAVIAALTQLGVQYRSHTSEPGVGFDCSGLTSYAWRRAGVTIARSSGDQIADAAPRRRVTASAGDLVHYPGHVMLYLGVGRAIVHASDPRDDVELAFIRQDRPVRWGDPTG